MNRKVKPVKKPGENSEILNTQQLWPEISDKKRIEELEAKLEELQKAQTLVQALHELAVVFRTASAEKEIWSAGLDILLQASGLDCGGLYFFDEKSHLLELVHHKGLSENYVNYVSAFTADSPNARLVLNRQMLYRSSSDLQLHDIYREEGLLSALIIPVYNQELVFGCINLASHILSEIPEASIKIVENLAIELGNLIMYRHSQTALHESETRRKAMFNAIPDMVFRLDSNGIFLDYKADVRDLYEQSVSLIGLRNRDVTPPEFADLIDQKIAETLESRKLQTFEYQMHIPGTGLLDFEARMAPGGTDEVIAIIRNITERKQAEEKSKLSERTLRLFVEYAPAAIAMFDREMNYIAASRRYLHDYRLNVENLTGRNHYDVFPDMPERWKEIHRRCLEGNVERREEDPFHRADGTIDWVHWEIYPWFEKDNEIGGLLLFSEVITERKKNQDLIRQNEESFKVLFEQNAVPMWVYDPETLAFLAVNDAAMQHYGYSRQEFLEMTLGDIRPAEDMEKLYESVNKRNTEYEITGPWRHIRKDNSVILVQIASHRIVWQGRPGIIVVAFDQTSRIMAEEARVASEVRFRELAENIQEVFWVYDHDQGRIVYISPGYMQIWGRTPESLYQNPRTYIESIHPDDQPEMFKSLEVQALGKQTVIEYRIIRPDGSIRWIWDRSVPIFESGLLKRSIGVASNITERKQAEKALFESDERFRKAFLTSPDAININRLENSIFVSINNGFTQITGYTESDVLGKSSLDVQLWVDIEDRNKLVENLKQYGFISNLDARFRMKSGEIRNGLMSASIIMLDEIPHYISITRDITERKKTEEKLRASEEKYRGLIESIDSVVAMVDEKGCFLYMNKLAASQFGKPVEELTGKSMYELFPQHVAERQMGNILTSIRENRILSLENLSIVAGKPVWYKTTILPIHDSSGKILHVLVNAVDITQLKTIQQELTDLNTSLEEKVRERSAQVQDLYDNAPVGYHSLDAEAKLIAINQTELNWLGYAREEIIGKHVSTIYKFGSPEAFNKAFLKLKNSGKTERVELTVMRKDGSLFPAEINATAIYDNEGNFISSRSTLQDITIRKKAEAAMDKALIEAETANRSKSDFLANMSHEIRTPMNAILGYSELLSSLVKDGTARDYLESIKSSGKTLLTLINDILDLSKIEAGKLELEFGYIEAASFFTEFERIFAFQTQGKGISFITEISPEIPPFLYVDETRLRQVVLNLAGNAVKFTEKGHIKIRVATENKRKKETDLLISVEDTGIGIAEESVDDIFGAFVQVKTKMSAGGTGLGLAISQRLARLMQGRISVKSESGKGSTFILTISDVPYLDSYQYPDRDESIDPESVIFDKAIVLIVDDVDENRKLFREALKETGLEVIEAVGGISALEIMKIRKPDLVISDIRMPGMDGFELLKAIKADNNLRSIPVIAYSALAMKDQKQRISKSKFAGLLVKPVRISDLFTELTKNLPHRLKETTAQPVDYEEPGLSAEVNDPKELISLLEGSFLERIKTFEKRQPMGAVKKFGQELAELGKNHNCQLIEEYGTKLFSAADNFDINGMLKLISQYREMLETVKKLIM